MYIYFIIILILLYLNFCDNNIVKKHIKAAINNLYNNNKIDNEIDNESIEKANENKCSIESSYIKAKGNEINNVIKNKCDIKDADDDHISTYKMNDLRKIESCNICSKDYYDGFITMDYEKDFRNIDLDKIHSL